MKTASEVQQAISTLVQTHIARESRSPFTEARVSDGSLIVGVRDKEGTLRNFNISVEETTEAPVLASPQSQPQEGAGKVAQANEGCCQGTQTCGEATTASPAQEDANATTEDNEAADAKEASPAT